MISRFRMTVAFTVTTATLSCSLGNAEDATILARWKFRKALLNKFKCEYSSVSTLYPAPDRLKRVGFRTANGELQELRECDKPTIRKGMFLFDEHRIKQTFHTPETLSPEDSGSHIRWMSFVSTDNQYESLTATFGNMTLTRQAGPVKVPPKDLYLDIALGLRLWGCRDRLSDDQILNAQVIEKGEDQLKVNFSGERGILHSAGISLRNGFDILSWKLFDEQGKQRLEILPSGYTDEGSLSLPHLIQVTMFRPDGSLVERTEIKIQRFEVGIDSVKEENFQIDWPHDKGMVNGGPAQE